MYSEAMPRAALLRAELTESSRSMSSTSAPEPTPLASFLSSSAGMNSKERMGSHLRSLAHHRLPLAFGYHLTSLVEGLVQELDDARVGPRLGFPFAHHLRREVERIAVEHRLGELDIGHAEVAHRGADGGIADRDADHDAQREERVHQRLAPLALGSKVVIDVQRLRVVREAGE